MYTQPDIKQNREAFKKTTQEKVFLQQLEQLKVAKQCLHVHLNAPLKDSTQIYKNNVYRLCLLKVHTQHWFSDTKQPKTGSRGFTRK